MKKLKYILIFFLLFCLGACWNNYSKQGETCDKAEIGDRICEKQKVIRCKCPDYGDCDSGIDKPVWTLMMTCSSEFEVCEDGYCHLP